MSSQPSYGYGAYDQSPHQQQQQQSSVVVVNQPMTEVRNGQQQNIQQWSTGLCGCFEDCGSCCCAFWCYPCFLCQLSTEMGECLCGPICCGSGHKWGGLHAHNCPNMFLVAMRTKLRTKYGIQGSICDDICCVWCCEFCIVTQMHRELLNKGALNH